MQRLIKRYHLEELTDYFSLFDELMLSNNYDFDLLSYILIISPIGHMKRQEPFQVNEPNLKKRRKNETRIVELGDSEP